MPTGMDAVRNELLCVRQDGLTPSTILRYLNKMKEIKVPLGVNRERVGTKTIINLSKLGSALEKKPGLLTPSHYAMECPFLHIRSDVCESRSSGTNQAEWKRGSLRSCAVAMTEHSAVRARISLLPCFCVEKKGTKR